MTHKLVNFWNRSLTILFPLFSLHKCVHFFIYTYNFSSSFFDTWCSSCVISNDHQDLFVTNPFPNWHYLWSIIWIVQNWDPKLVSPRSLFKIGSLRSLRFIIFSSIIISPTSFNNWHFFPCHYTLLKLGTKLKF